jgi:hypothetical protein
VSVVAASSKLTVLIQESAKSVTAVCHVGRVVVLKVSNYRT